MSAPSTLLPPSLAVATQAFCTVHRFWRGYWRFSHMSESAHQCSLGIAGYITAGITTWIPGSRRFIEIPARILLAAKAIVDSIEAHEKLKCCYEEWKELLIYTPNEPKKYISIDKWSLVAPRLREELDIEVNGFLTRIEGAREKSLQLLAAMFKVSMSLMDLFDAFSSRREAGDEAIRDLYLNAAHLFSRLTAIETKIPALFAIFSAQYQTSVPPGVSVGVSILSTLERGRAHIANWLSERQEERKPLSSQETCSSSFSTRTSFA